MILACQEKIAELRKGVQYDISRDTETKRYRTLRNHPYERSNEIWTFLKPFSSPSRVAVLLLMTGEAWYAIPERVVCEPYLFSQQASSSRLLIFEKKKNEDGTHRMALIKDRVIMREDVSPYAFQEIVFPRKVN